MRGCGVDSDAGRSGIAADLRSGLQSAQASRDRDVSSPKALRRHSLDGLLAMASAPNYKRNCGVGWLDPIRMEWYNCLLDGWYDHLTTTGQLGGQEPGHE